MSELLRRFSTHQVTDEQNRKIEHLRSLCYNLAVFIDNTLENGREKAFAVTKLEEVMFWGNAGIARPKGD